MVNKECVMLCRYVLLKGIKTIPVGGGIHGSLPAHPGRRRRPALATFCRRDRCRAARARARCTSRDKCDHNSVSGLLLTVRNLPNIQSTAAFGLEKMFLIQIQSSKAD